MADIEITNTEINPTYSEGYGGGRRSLTHTEINPTYLGGGGGGFRIFTLTEQPPYSSWLRNPGLNPPMLNLFDFPSM